MSDEDRGINRDLLNKIFQSASFLKFLDFLINLEFGSFRIFLIISLQNSPSIF